MPGHLIEFTTANGSSAPGYLARPSGTGPGVVVLHEWWGLTESIRQACERLADDGFVALAPDLYRGKTTASVEEASALGAALDRDEERWRGDITGALAFLRRNTADDQADSHVSCGVLACSLGGAYALDLSITRAEEIAAVVTVYATYPDLDFRGARAAYLCHFAEEDPYISAEEVAEMERVLTAAGRPATFYTYPGTKHSFLESTLPEAYDAPAAAVVWERTLAFLHDMLA